jgi:hypothetical protein
LQEAPASYAETIAKADGRLYLTGISTGVHDQVVRTPS